MVYAVIVKSNPELIKIGHSDKRIRARWSPCKVDRYINTWTGGLSSETALRCLLGLVPAKGMDWFALTPTAIKILENTQQDYIDFIADQVERYRYCQACGNRFMMRHWEESCSCGRHVFTSHLIGQKRAYCKVTTKVRAAPKPIYNSVTLADGTEFGGDIRWKRSEHLAYLRKRNSANYVG